MALAGAHAATLPASVLARSVGADGHLVLLLAHAVGACRVGAVAEEGE